MPEHLFVFFWNLKINAPSLYKDVHVHPSSRVCRFVLISFRLSYCGLLEIAMDYWRLLWITRDYYGLLEITMDY